MISGGAMLGAAVLGAFALGEGPSYGWQWRKRADLPARRSQAGATEYETHLEDRDVSTTLLTVTCHLQSVIPQT
jgi:hypothetical protein